MTWLPVARADVTVSSTKPGFLLRETAQALRLWVSKFKRQWTFTLAKQLCAYSVKKVEPVFPPLAH